MKIKIKKIIASVLTFMMIFTQVPVNVFAADTNISRWKYVLYKYTSNI